MNVTRRTLLTTAAGAAATVTASGTTPAVASDSTGQTVALRAAADYAAAKLRVVAPGVTAFPTGTEFEKWVYSHTGDWVGGFWPGTLWMAYLHTGDEQFRALALTSAEKLAPRRSDTSTHDLGFLFSPSWVTAWRITGDAKWRDGAIEAASSLVQRYNPRGHFIRAWGALPDPKDAGRIIMDTIMNLDLLDFATRQTGDSRYRDIAVEHAKTAQRVFVRPDGSTPHVFDFDPATGKEIGPGTVQGYSAQSCWSRGQSWGIYGFTTMYRRTGEASFLTTACRLADFALRALPPDSVPVWDYLAPQAPYDVKDASAGVVMACGLIDLAGATRQPRYREAGLRILSATARTCLTTTSTRAQAVVARCTRNRPSEDGVEISLPYADYYLLEGILRVLKPKELDAAIDLSSER
ncbi:glycoside hydrolase family 88 protein [Amycolatopsis jiangsuensis]|uniref:Unsaturated chondroitin disaccharide hydrolase n=1 Tax=Amycolatopsis jiangsuensis TaxID=1181879 RepID=A0A840IV77_9PSEU|nr:glycoside hydrolase family 88 protein [Amycolatopsis jiangsuensis]MBB4685673.1 unsaturated chondroitin disaccharide hydrolase [Amycolatopsis jiangsuensis]